MTGRNIKQLAGGTLGFLADFIAVVAFIGGLIAFVLASTNTWPEWVRNTLLVFGWLLVGASVGVISTWLILRRRAPLGYKLISIEQTYQLSEDNPRVQRLLATITVEAIRDNVYLFVDRTQWTGARPPRLSLLSSEQSLLVSPFAFEGWRTYVAAFKKPLTKGQRTDVKLQVEFIDESDDPEHWTSKTPLDPIRDHLTLRIDLGRNCPDLDRFESVIMRPGVGQNAIVGRLTPKLDKASGIASVTIKKPRTGLRYQLKTELPLSGSADSLDWDNVKTPW